MKHKNISVLELDMLISNIKDPENNEDGDYIY